jgi:hypothetical protein
MTTSEEFLASALVFLSVAGCMKTPVTQGTPGVVKQSATVRLSIGGVQLGMSPSEAQGVRGITQHREDFPNGKGGPRIWTFEEQKSELSQICFVGGKVMAVTGKNLSIDGIEFGPHESVKSLSEALKQEPVEIHAQVDDSDGCSGTVKSFYFEKVGLTINSNYQERSRYSLLDESKSR